MIPFSKWFFVSVDSKEQRNYMIYSTFKYVYNLGYFKITFILKHFCLLTQLTPQILYSLVEEWDFKGILNLTLNIVFTSSLC